MSNLVSREKQRLVSSRTVVPVSSEPLILLGNIKSRLILFNLFIYLLSLCQIVLLVIDRS